MRLNRCVLNTSTYNNKRSSMVESRLLASDAGSIPAVSTNNLLINTKLVDKIK